jgi:mannose-6-phosphate isomerase-like protein (cupin superfamily)
MDAVHTIAKGSVTYALFFPKSLKAPEGVRFLTKEDMPLQVGLMERTKGYVVQPHAHPASARHLHSTPEFLYIESGTLRIKVFDEEWVLLEEREVGAGDFVLLLAGGHSVEIVSDARFIEVKQGPFVGVGKDKISPPAL